MEIKEQVTKYCGKEEKLLLRSNFSSFPHYFIYIFLTLGVKLHIHLLNVVVRFLVFVTFHKSDMSRNGYLDNESQLYFLVAIFVAR